MSSKRIESLSTTDASGAATYSDEHEFTTGREFPCGVSVVVTGTVNYTLQYSNDKGVTWHSHDTLSGLTATAVSNFLIPVAKCRLKQNSGSGSCVMTVVESA